MLRLFSVTTALFLPKEIGIIWSMHRSIFTITTIFSAPLMLVTDVGGEIIQYNTYRFGDNLGMLITDLRRLGYVRLGLFLTHRVFESRSKLSSCG